MLGLLAFANPAAAGVAAGSNIATVGHASSDLLLVQVAPSGGQIGGANAGGRGDRGRAAAPSGGRAAAPSGGRGDVGGRAIGSPNRGGDGARTVTRNRDNDGDRRVRNGGGERARVIVRDNDGDRRYRGGGDRYRGERRGTRYVWGGLPFFFYDGYYHGDCGWLRRKARETGSSYWLARYRRCREDD